MDITENTKAKNGKLQHFVTHCLNLYEKFKESEYRQEKIDDIKEAYRIYKHKPDKSIRHWDGESNVVLPLLSITVDNLEPRLVAGLVGKKPVVQFDMPGMTEQDPGTKILQQWFNDELSQTVGVERVAGTVIHKALLEGTVYPVATYEEDETVRRDFVFDEQGQLLFNPETGEPVVQEITDNIFQGGRVRFAEFNDVYVDDDVVDWESADIIRVVRPTFGDLMRDKDYPGYLNIGKWLVSDEVEPKEMEEEDKPISGSAENVEVGAEEVIECLECTVNYTFQEEDQTKEEVTDWTRNRYIALIEKKSGVILRFRPLIDANWKNEPLIKRIRLFGEEGKSYGTSMYSKIKSIQNGATDLYNMTMDINTICMIPWFLYTDAAGWEGGVKIKPGEGIRVDDVSQVNFPKFNQNPRNNIVFIEMFMGFWERSGSITDLQVGKVNDSSKDVTATETMAAIQEGNIKHNYQGVTLKEDFLKLIRTLYDLYYQKMPYDYAFIHQGQSVPIPRNAMRRPYSFKLVGSSDMSNKIIQMKKAESKYQMLRQDPVINPIQLVTDYVESTEEDAIPSKYINPQINQLLEILNQNPEIASNVIPQYLQQKQQAAVTQEQAMRQEQAQNAGTAAGQAIAQAMGMGGQ